MIKRSGACTLVAFLFLVISVLPQAGWIGTTAMAMRMPNLETVTITSKSNGHEVIPTLVLDQSVRGSNHPVLPDFIFSVKNQSKKTVKEFTAYLFSYNKSNERFPSEQTKVLKYAAKDIQIKKGETYSFAVRDFLFEPESTKRVFCGIKSVVYTDGTVDTIPDGDIRYDYWDQKSGSFVYASYYIPCANSYGKTNGQTTQSAQNAGAQSSAWSTAAPNAKPTAKPAQKNCGVCNGKGKCHICKGNGYSYCSGRSCYNGRCRECNGTGRYKSGNTYRDCLVCSGDGKCNICDGTGKIKCTWCRGSGDCSYCSGTGKMQ